MNEHIHVWRDRYGSYEHVGLITAREDHVTFGYDRGYAGPAISVRLPVREERYSERDTELFFTALVPEGKTRIDFLDALRAGRSEYAPLLERLNNESTGALVFSTAEEEPGHDRSYEVLSDDTLNRLAREPEDVAIDIVGQTRLSLAGAMAKIGLYRDGVTGSLMLPHGSAPSTHIVKAGNARLFPMEILNEALCLEIARLCDLPVEDFELIGTPSGPLIAVRRFDRPFPTKPLLADGHVLPMRLHQEDFCQLGGTKLKYEPTEGHYLRFAASNASRWCANGFGNAMMVMYYTTFSYLVGNCDNHLKNLSVLYSADWKTREVAPLYDVVDTTIYSRLKDTMGISWSKNRSIFGVSENDVRETLRDAGLPVELAMQEFRGLAEEVLAQSEAARDHLVALGFPEINRLYDVMRPGMEKRARFEFSESSRLTMDSR